MFVRTPHLMYDDTQIMCVCDETKYKTMKMVEDSTEVEWISETELMASASYRCPDCGREWKIKSYFDYVEDETELA